MTFNILASGGVGTKILRLIAGCGDAIRQGIDPQDIRVIDRFFLKSDLGSGDFRDYHNTQDIFDYVKINLGSYVRSTDATRYPKYGPGPFMIDCIISFVQSPLRSSYLKVRNPRILPRENESCAMWVRGKDRQSNIQIFSQLTSNMENQCKINVLSNDENFITKSPILSKYYASTTSLNDYHLLLNSGSIYSQMSGYVLASFLISPNIQTLILLDKSYHSSDEYPFLEKDWNFYMLLLEKLQRVCQNKSVKLFK